jgi:hypothetical protein
MFSGGAKNNPPEETSNSMKVFFLFLCLSVAAGSGTASASDAPASDAALNETLDHARKSVKAFWEQFQLVTCVEKVTQEKLGKKGKLEHKQRTTFDYLAILDAGKNGLSVEESRTVQGKSSKANDIPMLNTAGVSTLLLVFHPYYRDDFRYQLAGEELTEGIRLVKILFTHIPGTKSTSALRLRAKDYPLDIEGTAWIDPETGAIHRITARISSPMNDLNLKSLDMDVAYLPFSFSSGRINYWLPSTAIIEIKTEHQRWRNTHLYSRYRKFSVTSEEVVAK